MGNSMDRSSFSHQDVLKDEIVRDQGKFRFITLRMIHVTYVTLFELVCYICTHVTYVTMCLLGTRGYKKLWSRREKVKIFYPRQLFC